ncbi:MAG: hypothetical protein CMD02_00445 [Flavobacteriales bacterium]|nr:hypothetical protein [Flavobacteriales bacterium]|tara:strand:+ start:2941 stop:3834 length:894 start_codon:yes stop_codon:yes gene_type:complete
MKKILLSLMISTIIFNPIKSYSQSDNDAAIIGGAAAMLSIYAAIEQQKEMLEQQALNYLLSSHPEYTNFRLKVIGLGQGGKKLSDNSDSYIIPFSLVMMDGEKLTSNKKLLFLYVSSNWANGNGIDFSKWKWEIYDSKKWNFLMSEFFEIISCSKLSISNDSIIVYSKIKGYSPETDEKNGYDYITRVERIDKEDVSVYYKKQNLKVHISQVRLTKEGLTATIGGKFSGRKLVYPFLELKGDDYRVKDFDDSFKIFCNENSLGLFRKDTEDAMLLSRILMRKIHTFINDDSIDDFKE